MPEIDVGGGVKINYTTEGTEPESIVFIHGLGQNLECWRQQIKYFSKKFKAIAVDLRGHGKSGTQKKKVEMLDFAKDILSLLDGLAIKKAHFCGLSLGGLVVFELYKIRPETFASMILVGTRPQYPPAQTAALEGMSMEIIGEEVATFALAANAPEPLRKEVARMVASTRKDAYIQSAEASSMLNYTDLLPTIRVPALIIVGDKDIVAPVDSAEQIRKNLTGSILKVMQGVGHLPNQERPEEFDAIVEEFVKSVERV